MVKYNNSVLSTDIYAFYSILCGPVALNIDVSPPTYADILLAKLKWMCSEPPTEILYLSEFLTWFCAYFNCLTGIFIFTPISLFK